MTRLNPMETRDVRRPLCSVPETRSGFEYRLDDESAFDALRKGLMGGTPLNPALFSFFGNGAAGGLAV